MLSAKPLSFRFMSAAFLAASLASFGLHLRAQDVPPVHVGDNTITGIPDDWSHHHVIFGNPGTEQNAVKNGTYEQWNRIVHSPRYIMHQLRHNLPVQGPSSQDVEIRRRIERQEHGDRDRDRDRWHNRRHRDHNKPIATDTSLVRDWSMNMGGSAASLTISIATPGSSNVSDSSTLTVDGVAFDAGPATPATGVLTEVNTPSTSGTPTLVVGGITYIFTTSTGISSTQSANTCTVHVSQRTTTETNLLGAMSGTGGSTGTYRCNSDVGANSTVTVLSSVNNGGTHTITLASKTTGSASTIATPTGGDVSNGDFTWGSTTAGSWGVTDGTATPPTFAYRTGATTYVSASQLAINIASAVNANTTVNVDLTATANSPTTGKVTFQATAAGPGGNLISVSQSSFTAVTGVGNLAGGTAGGIAGQYPAKFSLSSASSVNCGGATQPDYVVYPTGMAGSSTSATIVAYDNIYASCGGTIPTVYWAYNTGTGTVVTSPVLSGDGTKVAFVETPSGGAATLRILKFAAGEGTDTSTPVAPAGTHTNSTEGAGGNTAWSGCTGTSCMISVAFQNGDTDTNSSPFYDYANDLLYIGDDSGVLHKFSGVFSSTPAEVTTGGWPVTLAGVLTSPVIDPATGSIFVGSSNGRLYQITTPTATPATVTSGIVAAGKGIVDSPIVDSTSTTTPYVYVFVGDDNGGTIRSAVIRFANNFIGGDTGAKTITPGGGTTGSTTLVVYDGDFDNTHYSGDGTTGYLYFCGGSSGTPANPTLYQVAMNSGFPGTATTVENLTSGAATCSPTTEFYNTGSGATALTTTTSTTVVTPSLASSQGFGSTSLYLDSYTGVAAGDYVLVGFEYELVNSISNIGGTHAVVSRGQLGTTAVTHNTPLTVTVFQNTITVASGANISNGDYIQVDSETMNVTGGGGTTTLTVTRGALGTTMASHVNPSNVAIPALDWLFLGVTANGTDTGCTGACLYNYYIGTPLGAGGAATNGLNASGGPTGIIIDNAYTSDGSSQVYYSTLSSQSCTGNGTQGTGTGGCAIQASQSGLQ